MNKELHGPFKRYIELVKAYPLCDLEELEMKEREIDLELKIDERFKKVFPRIYECFRQAELNEQ